jgi:hypothetical protein
MPTSTDPRSELRVPAQIHSISRESLETLADLLDAIRKSEGDASHVVKMLSATAAHLAIHLGQPPDKIEIRQLLAVRPGLRLHLKERGFKRNSIRSYCNYVRIFLQKAEGLGWTECAPPLLSAWQEIRQAVAKTHGCIRIVEYAIRSGKNPESFAEADLDDWGQTAVRDGRTCEYISRVKCRFRRRIFDAGLSSRIPGLLVPVNTGYGIPISQLPPRLRDEIGNLVRWKTAEFAPGRPSKAKIRPVTATVLTAWIYRIAGFGLRIKGQRVSSLEELLSEQSVSEFVEWALNQREVTSRSVKTDLCRLRGLRAYPALAACDFSWVLKLIAQLPQDCESKGRERKEANRVPFDKVARIPEQIRREAQRDPTPSEVSRALMMRNALVMAFLTILPWRQGNIRNCKLGTFAKGGNLAKEEIPVQGPPYGRLSIHVRIWMSYASDKWERTAALLTSLIATCKASA